MTCGRRFLVLQRIAVTITVCFSAVGCAGMLKQGPVAKAYFAIDSTTADLHGQTTRPFQQVLMVRTLRVSPPYDAVTFVYRIGPSQFDTDYYNNFIAPPASLLTGQMIQWFSANLPVTVCDPSSDLTPTLILEGNITDLYIDSTAMPGPKAVVGGRFFFTDQRGGTVKLLFWKHYQASAPASTRSAAGFASAWGNAYRQLLTDLTADVKSNLHIGS